VCSEDAADSMYTGRTRGCNRHRMMDDRPTRNANTVDSLSRYIRSVGQIYGHGRIHTASAADVQHCHYTAQKIPNGQ